MTTLTSSPATSGGEVEPASIRAWESCTIVDVREPDERAAQFIVGSISMPLSRFDPASLPRAGRIVFHCQGGRRSMEAMTRAAAAGVPQVFSMKGGINAWKSAGLEVQRNARVPISIIRQVQITVGTMVTLFGILTLTVDPWFVTGAMFFGCGLLFAGLSGTCGLAAMLSIMPWNRAFRAACNPTQGKP